ncbi:30S ribosomal protein S16 [Candidatus Saccharibacteria bacterium]|nr:30S ribosomal protein S16 [Candidatus Saccharibacteria bacterium]
MLAIRMQRNGRAHLPMYRIVVQEAQRHPLSGRVVAEVGNYNPATKKVVLDTEKVEFYLKNGAKPSSRVAFVFKKNGVKLPDWYKEAPAKSAKGKHQDKLRKNQPKEEPVEEAPAEAPAEEAPVEEAPAAEEAPAEEAPAETPAE